MSLVLPGAGQDPPRAHVCNVYCIEDTHAQVFYRRADEASPQRAARAGDRVIMYGRWARIIRVESAPEAPDPKVFVASSKTLWLFRWEGS